ncbi:MAG: hypothetical protein ACRECV_11710 [Xanthobacteraceae bacterium]
MADPHRSKARTYQRLAFSVTALAGGLSLIAWKVLLPRRRAPAPEPVAAGASEHQQEESRPAFEPTDWALWPVAVVYVGVVALLVISCFVLIAAYPNAVPDVRRTLRIAPPGPRLQTDPRGDLRQFRAEEEKRLNTYYWINKPKGIVHIPIEQTIKKLATTGIPGFPKGQP